MTDRCYFDDEPCDCGAFDVMGDCPRDTLVHDDDEFVTEEMIDEAYYNTIGATHDDETNRF